MTARVQPLALVATLLLLPVVLLTCSGQSRRGDGNDAAAQQAWEAWRHKRVAEFKRSPGGWLEYTASGRLKPGNYLLGGEDAAQADIRLPVGDGVLGRLLLGEDKARYEPIGGGVKVPLEPANFNLHPGTRLEVGDGQLHLVRTGPLWGWRFRQPGAAARHPFKGFEVYPYDPRWRLRARWEPYEQPGTLTVLTTIGTPLQMPLIGEVRFDVDGRSHRLPVSGIPEGDRLLILFADRSSGRDTPAGGRLLVPPMPAPGQRWIELDFNLAQAATCSVTAHVVCPLPPPDARLPFVVEAGEKGWIGG